MHTHILCAQHTLKSLKRSLAGHYFPAQPSIRPLSIDSHMHTYIHIHIEPLTLIHSIVFARSLAAVHSGPWPTYRGHNNNNNQGTNDSAPIDHTTNGSTTNSITSLSNSLSTTTSAMKKFPKGRKDKWNAKKYEMISYLRWVIVSSQ